MSDKELVLEVLHQTAEAVGKVLRRFAPVNSVAYLTDTPEGMENLDAICMLLIAIGESLKHINKITDRTLLQNYPEIDWKGAKGLRDILSHHYKIREVSLVYGNRLERGQGVAGYSFPPLFRHRP